MRILAAGSLALLACHGRSNAGPDGAAGTASPSVSSSAAVDVTTHASPTTTSDAGEPVVTGGEVDGNTLRARTHTRLAADTSPVVVLQSKDARPAFDLGQRLCEAVVPRRPAGTPILLKPNI